MYKYGSKRARGPSGTPAKPSVGRILRLLRKRHLQPWNSQASAQQEGALSGSSHPDKTLPGLRPLLGFFLASPLKSDEVMERALKKIQKRQIRMIKRLEARTKGAAEVSLVEMRAGGEPSDLRAWTDVCWGPDQTLPPFCIFCIWSGVCTLQVFRKLYFDIGDVSFKSLLEMQVEQLKKKTLCTKYYRPWNLLLGTFLVTIVENPSSWFPCIEAFREVRPKKRKSMLESAQVGARGLWTCSGVYSL